MKRVSKLGEDMPKIKSGWTSSEFAVVAFLVGPWAMQTLGIDITTLAAIFGYFPTDAEQVEILAETIKGRSSDGSLPWVGFAYVVGRPMLKAYLAKIAK